MKGFYHQHLRFRGIFILACAFIAMQAGAQSILTLDEAIATALQNNYDIRVARNDSAIAALDYEYRNAAFYPRINPVKYAPGM